MRTLLVGLVVVGLLAGPAFSATIDVKILVNGSAAPALAIGSVATVEGWFKCNSTSEAICAIGGSVTASGPGLNVSGTLAASSFYTVGAWPFQGFQPLMGQPGTQIPPATPIAGANGSVTNIGSAQGMANQVSPAWIKTVDYGANNCWVKLFSYNVIVTAGGVVTLQWVEAAAGGNYGWYTTDTGMANGINTNTAAVVITPPPPPLPIASSVDYSVAGKRTLWRTKKNIVRLTCDYALTAAPTPGQIKIQECLPGGAYGPDLSSNFGFKLESNNTVVRIIDNSPNGVLLNRHWYCVRTESGSWPGMADFKKLTPVLVGDCDGNGVLSAAGDVNAIVTKLSSPSVAPNDADRRDVDGNMVISATADVNPAVAGLSSPTLPARPSGH